MTLQVPQRREGDRSRFVAQANLRGIKKIRMFRGMIRRLTTRSQDPNDPRQLLEQEKAPLDVVERRLVAKAAMINESIVRVEKLPGNRGMVLLYLPMGICRILYRLALVLTSEKFVAHDKTRHPCTYVEYVMPALVMCGSRTVAVSQCSRSKVETVPE